MDVERIIDDIEQLQEMFEAPDIRHSAQATSRLLIESTMKCSRTALGSGCGSSTGFAAEVKPKARIAFRASRFSRCKPIVTLNFLGLTDGCCGLPSCLPARRARDKGRSIGSRRSGISAVRTCP